MPRHALEIADIFRAHGLAWRSANAGHISLGQLKVMSAIERCRTAALGGHVAACEKCDHTHIAYNSCRNRHCPKCQGAAAREWLAARQAELLPSPARNPRRHGRYPQFPARDAAWECPWLKVRLNVPHILKTSPAHK